MNTHDSTVAPPSISQDLGKTVRYLNRGETAATPRAAPLRGKDMGMSATTRTAQGLSPSTTAALATAIASAVEGQLTQYI
jgi:hypothetical protein